MPNSLHRFMPLSFVLVFACATTTSQVDSSPQAADPVAAIGDQLADALTTQDRAKFEALLHDAFPKEEGAPVFALLARAVHELGPRSGATTIREKREGMSKFGPVTQALTYAYFERGRIELNYHVVGGRIASFSIEEDETFAPLLKAAAAETGVSLH
jgi:hypothetical protein